MLNGINISGLSEFVNEVKKDQDEAIASYGLSLNWQSGTRSEASTTTMNLGPHRVSRNFKWTVDEPRQLLGTNHGGTPQELLLSGVAGCILVSYVVGASVNDIQIESLDVEISGQIDLRGFFHVDESCPVGLQNVNYKVNVRSNASKEQLMQLHQQVQKKSPNLMSLKQSVPVEGKLVIL